MSLRTVLLVALLAPMLTACNAPDREPGDDPNRADEGPTAGRPTTDAQQSVEPKDASGGGDDDFVNAPEDGRGTLDGTSDEIAAPANP